MPGRLNRSELERIVDLIKQQPKEFLAEHPQLAYALFVGLAFSTEAAVVVQESNGSTTVGP